jgi:hypothetical protein
MSSAVALLSIFLLAMAIEGYGIGGPLIFLERLLAFAGAIILPFPLIFNRVTSFWVALALLIAIIAQQRLRKRRTMLAMAAAPAKKKT